MSKKNSEKKTLKKKSERRLWQKKYEKKVFQKKKILKQKMLKKKSEKKFWTKKSEKNFFWTKNSENQILKKKSDKKILNFFTWYKARYVSIGAEYPNVKAHSRENPKSPENMIATYPNTAKGILNFLKNKSFQNFMNVKKI